MRALLVGLSLVGLSFAVPPATAAAQDPPSAAVASAPVETDHELEIAGATLRYRARAGFLPVIDPEEPAADMFFVAYERLDAGPVHQRPVTFLLNGGPGAASVYLHLGVAGPKRVVFQPDGRLPPPPVELAPNARTWLRFTDLVFIDPVGTGYSRERPREEAESAGGSGGRETPGFFEVERDIEAIGAFVRLWLDRFDRRLSPKFVVGESYGGFRAALLAHELAARFDIRPNGVVLVSPVLEFDLLRGGEEHNLLPWVTRFASLAVTAGYHDRGLYAGIGEDPGARAGEIEDWAREVLLPGLADLPYMDEGAQQDFYREVASRLGLPPELVARHRGRIGSHVFAKELLRERGLLVGLYDGRLTGPDPRPSSPQYGRGDPSFDYLTDPFAAAFSAYAATELGFRTDRRYEVLARDIARKWDYTQALDGSMGFVGAGDELTHALAVNPSLQVLAIHGYHDLVTTWPATRWVLDHLPLPREARTRIELLLLPGGHMFYLREAGLATLDTAMEGFYRRAGARSAGP